MRMRRTWAAVLAVLAWAGLAQAAQIEVATTPNGGVYAAGDKITWHLTVTGEGAADIKQIDYALKRGGLTEIGKGTLPLTDGHATLETSLDKPGAVLAQLSAVGADGKKVTALAGAIVDPYRIQPSAPRPDDFDAFWAAKLKELAAVPEDPVLEKMDSGNPNVDYWHITLGNINGTRVWGQLARPKAGTKFPALLIVQWAGVYPLHKDWAVGRAAQGWLVLNISAHDLPIDKPQSFYDNEPSVKDYPSIGNDDRDTSYFLRMYLGDYRAADYLAHRPDWDGRTLVVTGGSQGGMQSYVTAALYPDITAMVCDVPAGADQTGPEVGRQCGWPMWWWQTQGKDAAKVRETARYFDTVNLASRITCPALVGAGLIDETCPPEGCLAAYNQLKGPKQIILYERAGHGGDHSAYWAASEARLRALREGQGAAAWTQK